MPPVETPEDCNYPSGALTEVDRGSTGAGNSLREEIIRREGTEV